MKTSDAGSPPDHGPTCRESAEGLRDVPAFARPIDPDENRRIRGRRAAKRWIEPLILAWFVAYAMPYLLLIFFSKHLGPSNSYGRTLLALLGASHLFSLFAAAAVAFVTARNLSALSRGWIAVGLFPWAVFVAELTAMYVVTRL